ncbi:rabphilin-3A-like [Passer montanus]|uniref:rabphilin-3A-like n=1 Tax=Passer montanus TaxID=9160 RepID=UPI0019614732|nr:rabphilin-3A-like [Passer montanus]
MTSPPCERSAELAGHSGFAKEGARAHGSYNHNSSHGPGLASRRGCLGRQSSQRNPFNTFLHSFCRYRPHAFLREPSGALKHPRPFCAARSEPALRAKFSGAAAHAAAHGQRRAPRGLLPIASPGSASSPPGDRQVDVGRRARKAREAGAAAGSRVPAAGREGSAGAARCPCRSPSLRPPVLTTCGGGRSPPGPGQRPVHCGRSPPENPTMTAATTNSREEQAQGERNEREKRVLLCAAVPCDAQPPGCEGVTSSCGSAMGSYSHRVFEGRGRNLKSSRSSPCH